jgi:dihydroorotate dehydrogenase
MSGMLPPAHSLPRYDPSRTYEWNYEHAPLPIEVDVPPLPGEWRFCGLPVGSPLGIPAGPLLNGRWILYYASLGFDVLTYKTVRSRQRACCDLPNLQAVAAAQLTGREETVAASEPMNGSWAVSFGMPSRAPDVWRADIESTRRALPPGKVLSVSVVGTVRDGWSIEDLARDYAQCARWAVESGADCIEANFSCPNVATCDGQLYQDNAAARLVAQQLRQAVGRTPLAIKIGHVVSREAAETLLDSLGDVVDALSMVNTVAATVRGRDGEPMFAGQRRGIAGEAIRDASLAQVRLFAELVHQRRLATQIIGVGGVANAADVQAHLAAGACAVHIATAAMLHPAVGLAIRHEWARLPGS